MIEVNTEYKILRINFKSCSKYKLKTVVKFYVLSIWIGAII
jgi:hypothetical protein